MKKSTALLAAASALAVVGPAADIRITDALVTGDNLVIAGWTDRANHLSCSTTAIA